MFFRSLVLVILLHCCCAFAAHSTPERLPLNTERPCFADSSLTVGKSVLLIESGWSRESGMDSSGSPQTVTQTPLLVREGVSDHQEIRLGTEGYVWQQRDLDRAEGWGDLLLGVKWHHVDQKGARPAVGSILDILLPTGAKSIRGHGARPALKLSLDWDLSNRLSSTFMSGIAYNSTESGERYAAPLANLLFSYRWTSRLQTFIEEAGLQFAAPRFGGNVLLTNVGAVYLLTPDLQLDGAIAWGHNHFSPNVFYTAGFSFRI